MLGHSALFRYISSLAFIAAVALSANAAVASSKSLSIAITRDLTDTRKFHISVSFKGDSDGITRVQIPNEWGGQENLFNAVHDLRIKAPAVIGDTSEPFVKQITHRPNQSLTIEYDLVQDFKGPLRNQNRYRPVVEDQYIHWIGHTVWVLPDWGADEKVSVKLEWRGLSKSWTLANSFGVGKHSQRIETDFENLGHSINVAGDFRLTPMLSGGRPINVMMRGSWQFEDDELAGMIRRVIESQRDFWNDRSQPNFLVTLVPLDEGPNSYSYGGTGLDNSFALFATPQASVASLRGLLAHEYFHNWNPTTLGRMPDPEQQIYWFSEGFTEFYTYRLLFRGGLMTRDEYIAKNNEIIREYYVLETRNAPNARIIKEFWSDRNVGRLPYLRGFMIATNWNTEIVKASDGKYSLDNVMFDLKAMSGGGKQELTPELISKAVQKYLGRDVTPDIARFVTDGETVSPLDGALGKDVAIETQKIPVFDAGFDLDELFKSKRIARVKPAGPAYAAGLRDGQQLAGGVSVYFGNTEKEIELKVKTSEGDKVLKYLPVAAEPALIPQYVLRSRAD